MGDRELSMAIKVGVELLLTALLLLMVVIMAQVSHKGELIMDRRKTVQNYMEASSNLYYYNNKIVKGSDVVDCISTFPRAYQFLVEMRGNTYMFNHDSEISSGQGLNLWSYDYINTIITSSDMGNSFKATFIKNPSGDIIEGIKFVME